MSKSTAYSIALAAIAVVLAVALAYRLAPPLRLDVDTVGVLLVLVVVPLAFPFYMLPTIIAWARGVPSTASLAIINGALGWTGLIWILCLAWAFSPTGRG